MRIFLLLCILVAFSCVHKKKKSPDHCGFCLSQGTLVRLANGKDILIERLKAGDTVLAFNRKTERFVASRVEKTFETEHAGFVKLNFPALVRNGVEVYAATSLILSNDHPVWINSKGWCSAAPEITKRVLLMKEVKKLAEGDLFYTNKDRSKEGLAGTAALGTIEKVNGTVKAYTIVKLENGMDCFLANGIVVGTEAMSMQEGGD